MKTSTQMFGTTTVTVGAPAPGEAWAEPGLLGKLAADVGTQVEVGTRKLTITPRAGIPAGPEPGIHERSRLRCW